MEKRERQRFCQSCHKCVIDFSEYSTAEIIQKLTSTTDSICGRLSQAQLDQLNYHLVLSEPTRNWVKYLGVLAIGASIFMLDTAAFAQAAPIRIEKSTITLSDGNKPLIVQKIYGYLVNEEKKPVVGAKVSINQTKLFGITDESGRYEIKLAANFNPKYKQMSIIHEGVVLTTMPFNPSKEKQKLIEVSTSPMLMGEIIIQQPLMQRPAIKLINPSN
ncbi:hypothetical protein [Pedobacter sp. Hv1]|uniref:hypothetical protein n=1 Tax=Pedobacter sp. Hv1 TaxID=1740090 RepID=UPI00128F77AD|nr:hypothetical protein [Pedobacter sp. Hv1]